MEARYVTLCVLLWDPATRQIVMANAGALPPMICRGGEILKIRVEGVPLGLLDAREYEEVAFQARAGRHPGALFRRHHRPPQRRRHANSAAAAWRKSCARIAAHPPDDLIAAIFKDLDKFSTTAFDDQTLFVMKVK